jgi:CDP-glycerol glycerophosphotransferase (TagB/SpsB family)
MHDARSLIAVAAATIWLLNTLIPKQNKAVLYGYPDGEDSIAEITRRLSERGDVRTILLVDSVASGSDLASKVVQLKRKSLRGLWHFLTARYVFFTHGLYLSPRPPRTQTCVNIWHGMPFKRIGHMLGRVPPHSSHVIATSKFFRSFVGQSFGKPEGEVLVTGIPRNDVMVRAAARSAEIKRAMGLAERGELPRLIVWLPTYREAVRGTVRTDGRSHSSIFGMDDMDVEAFEAFLAKNNCVCVAKPHPMAAEFNDKIANGRIRIWRDADLADHGLSLYEMVGAADLLITDASSVYVDYLILDRPVVIAFPDFDEYTATRGFSFERAEQYFAGPLVRSFAELCGAIAESFDTDSYAGRRRQVATLFHDVCDDKAAERLIDAVLPRQAPQSPKVIMQAQRRAASASRLNIHRGVALWP